MNDQPHVEQDGPETPRVGDLDVDPALAAAVLEIEQHVAAEGWDRPARLFALVALELFALEGVAAFVAGADLEDVLPRALSFAAPGSVPLKRFFCGRSGSTLA